MDIPPLQSPIKASAVPLDQLAGNPHLSQNDKVKEACRQFEAVLLRKILGEGAKSILNASDETESNEKDIYDDMINNQMADSISRSGSFGLAKSLESQLVLQVLPKPEAAAQAAPDIKPATKSTDY